VPQVVPAATPRCRVPRPDRDGADLRAHARWRRQARSL